MWFRRASGTFVIQDRAYPIKNNTLVYVPTLFMHEMILTSYAKHLRYLLQYEESWLEEMHLPVKPIQRIQPMVMYLDENEASRLETLFCWASEKSASATTLQSSLLHSIVIFVTSKLTMDLTPNPALFRHPAITRLIGLVQQIDEQKNYAISVAQAALRCGWSDSYFSRTFKQAFGQTFKEFMLKRKISLAIDLLINSDLNVSDIAYQASFTDCAYFCARFKHIVGMSPKKFKENIYTQ
ncbi:helix-turn-helix transcriptional regulator [Brenneria corticis]|nr:AraC family transcriptional regulator [Brenneria sp. CFCC 11842]